MKTVRVTKPMQTVLNTIRAANDLGQPTKSPARLQSEFEALDKLLVAGLVVYVPENNVLPSGYAISQHPILAGARFNAACCAARNAARSEESRARSTADAFDKILGTNQ